MAEIHTILTGENLTGQPMGDARPTDFGAQVGAAINDAGSSLGQTASVLAQYDKVKKNQSDTQWVSNSMSQEQNYVNKWMADPVNNAKNTFADDLQQMLNDRQQTYEKDAPNDDARRAFSLQFNDFSTSRLNSAYNTSASNQINGLQTSVLTQIDDVVDGYRISRGIPNLDANKDLVNNITVTSASIDKMFGKIAPETARQLKDKLVTDSVYGVMDYSPDFARKVLDMGSIEGHQRHAIESAIDEAERTKNSMDVAAFDQARQNQLAMVESGKSRDKIDHSLYYAHYSREQANAHILRDDTLIDIYNQTNDFVTKVSPYNSSAQIAELQKMKEGVGTNPQTAFRDQHAYELAATKIQDNLQAIHQDPVGYIVQHNPAIKKFSDQLSVAADAAKPVILKNMTDMMVRYQGPPTGNHELSVEELSKEMSDPSYVSPSRGKDDSNYYFNIPRNQVSVLTKAQATQFAGQINHGSPKDALKTIDSVLSQYPEEYRANAFNDMVKLPEGDRIKGEYWAAVLNKNATWVDDYLGVIQNADSIKKASTDKQSDFTKAMNSNVTWNQFANPLTSDNFQRESVTEDFKNGIMLYAMGLSQRSGMAPDAAIKTATDRILNSKLGLTSVNGKPVMVPREQSNGLNRTDVQVQDIGRRLNLSLNFIDPKEVKTSDEFGRNIFPSLNMIGHEDQKAPALRDAMLKNGTFQTTPDGKAAVLYYDDGINHFEMRDKTGKAFMVRFDDLPKLTPGPIAHGLMGFDLGHDRGMGVTDPLAPDIKKTYVPPDLTKVPNYEKMSDVEKMIVRGSGHYLYNTNWPTTPSWVTRK